MIKLMLLLYILVIYVSFDYDTSLRNSSHWLVPVARTGVHVPVVCFVGDKGSRVRDTL